MAEPRPAGVVGHAVGALVVVGGPDLSRAQRRRRRDRVRDLGQRVGGFRRLRVEDHPRAGADARAGGDAVLDLGGPAHEPGAVVLRVVGAEQSGRAAPQHFARERIDGLDQPGGGRHLLVEVDASRDAQDEAAGRGEVDVLREEALAGRHVDRDVADLDRAELERRRVQAGIQLHDDLDLVDVARGARIVLEVDRVGERRVGREEPVGLVGLRPRDRHVGRHRARGVEVVGEVERGERVRSHAHGTVDLEVRRQPGAPVLERLPCHVGVERLERGRRGQVLVVGRVLLDGGQRDVFEEALVLPRVVAVELRDVRRASVAVEGVQLVEEVEQVAGGADGRAGRAVEESARQHGHEALHVRLRADGRNPVGRQQDAGLLQRRQGQRLEPGLVRHQRHERGRGLVGRAVAGDDVRAELVRLVRHEGHELVSRHAGRRGEHAEAERDEQDHVLLGDRPVLLVVAHEIDLVEQARELRVVPGDLLLERAPPRVQPAGTVGQEVVEVRRDLQHLLAELREGAVAQVLQPRVGRHVDRDARRAVGRLVEQEAGRGELPVRVHGGAERAVGHVGVGAARHAHRRARDARGEREVRQCVDDVVGAEVRHADLEEGVGRVQVADVVQRHGVGGGRAREDRAVAADADHHVRLHRLRHQEPVGQDRLRTVRVRDDHVVLAERRARQVPHGGDRGAVLNLVGDRVVLRHVRPDELHGRLGGELRAADGGGDVLGIAAHVGGDVRDHQRQLFGREHDVAARGRA